MWPLLDWTELREALEAGRPSESHGHIAGNGKRFGAVHQALNTIARPISNVSKNYSTWVRLVLM